MYEYILETSLGEDTESYMERIDGFNHIHTLSDDSSIIFVDDYAFLKVEEANTEFEKENFELEVYMVKSEATDKNPEVLERLYFAKDDNIEDKHIEYYFDISFDFEIEEEEFCILNRRKQKIKNLYTDKIFKCEGGEHSPGKGFNIYGTSENQEIEDVCD